MGIYCHSSMKAVAAVIFGRWVVAGGFEINFRTDFLVVSGDEWK